MKLNLNARCRIALTQTGADQWNASFDCVPLDYRPAPKKAGDEIETQLWTAFQVFGPHIYMGMPQVPFESNDLEIIE